MKPKSFINKIIFVILFQIAIYVVLFILMPATPNDPARNSFTIISVTVFFSLIGVVFFVDKIRFWAIGFPLMWGMVMLYHTEYAYGIGWEDIINFAPSVPLSIFGISLLIFIIQCVLCLCKLAVVKISQKLKK